jgi:hypothetical protein
VATVGLDDVHGLVGVERMLQHRGIAQKAVQLSEDELRDGHVLPVLNGGQPGVGRRVAGRILLEGLEQDAGVDGTHEVSLSPAVARSGFRGGELRLHLAFRVA